jgi:hypothetical protein
MKAGLLIGGSEQGTLARLSAVFWKDIKKGRSVKKFLKVIEDELGILVELRNDTIKEFGEDGSLKPEMDGYEDAMKKILELQEQDVELKDVPELSDDDLVSPEGWNAYDISVLEGMGLLKEE